MLGLSITAFCINQSYADENLITDNDLIDGVPLFELGTTLVEGVNNEGYTNLENRTAFKMDMDWVDTPQSILVINSEVIEDQQASTLDEVLQNDSSVQYSGSLNGFRQTYSIRGFELDNDGNYLRDGHIYWLYDLPPVEFLDSVEVLKGPSSVLYGQGTPGGVINLRYKKPLYEPYASATVGIGSYDYFKTHFDVTGPVTESGNVAYRTNILLEKPSDYRVDSGTREAFYTVFDLNISENADLSIYFDFLNYERNSDNGWPVVNGQIPDLGRKTVLDQPWAENTTTTYNVGAELDLDINDQWNLVGAASFQQLDRHRINSNLQAIDNPDPNIYRVRYLNRDDTWRYYIGSIDLIGDVPIGKFDNEVLFGVSALRRTAKQWSSGNINLEEIDITNPIYIAPPDTYDITYEGMNASNLYGVYAQDIFHINSQLSVVSGLRYDWYRSVDRDGVQSPVTTHVTPRLGTVYELSDNTSTYLVYSGSFQPNDPVGNNSDSVVINEGEEQSPTIGYQYEWGIKHEAFNRRLAMSAALFYMVREDQPGFRTIEPEVFQGVQTGEQVHKGLELQITGQVTPNWQVISTGTWLHARITEDQENPEFVGNKPYAAPTLAASLYNQYQLPNKPEIKLFGGVNYIGEREGDLENSFQLPSATPVSLGASYEYRINERELLTFRANVDNVFNEEIYYSSSDRVTLGAPRIYKLSVQWEY